MAEPTQAQLKKYEKELKALRAARKRAKSPGLFPKLRRFRAMGKTKHVRRCGATHKGHGNPCPNIIPADAAKWGVLHCHPTECKGGKGAKKHETVESNRST